MAQPYTLIIGDKNFSSWSLRPWIAMKQFGIPFAEARAIRSALGGTIGSFLTGLLFQHVVGSIAFYATLVPVALIAMTLPAIRRRQRQAPMPAS